MNWGKIKKDYIAGKGSYRDLAAKYGVPLKTLSTQGKKEGWPQLRKQASDKAATKTVEAVADANGRVQTRMQDAAEALIGKTIEGIQAVQPEDAKMLKAYSGVLRDLKEVLNLRTDLDMKEQEARIAKLRREAEREQEDRNREIVVTYGGGAEPWGE